MRRTFFALLLLVAPWLALLVAGCEQKITTIQKEERIEQSEPRMVSPGEEQL
ncbi:MAG: hypothetical protein GXY44_04905 [Phycisphaerales bacterium]|nr:hypothetical protein [Phycisphaerales bacterium]